MTALVRHETGPNSEPPTWLPRRETRALTKIRQPEFLHALAELAWAHHRRVSAFKLVGIEELKIRASKIQRVRTVTEVWDVHSVSGTEVFVAAEAALVDEGIVLLRPRSTFDFDQMLAVGLARCVGAQRTSDVRTLANLCRRCCSAEANRTCTHT